MLSPVGVWHSFLGNIPKLWGVLVRVDVEVRLNAKPHEVPMIPHKSLQKS